MALRFLIISLWFQWTGLAMAQTQWQEMSWDEYSAFYKNVGEKYDMEAYHIDLRYSTYKGHKSTTPFESSLGYMGRKGGQSYSYVMGILTLQDDEIKVTVDSINMVVAINHAPEELSNQFSSEQFENSKQYIKSIGKRSDGDLIVLNLKYIDNAPIERMEFGFNKRSYLQYISTYYRDKKEYEDEEGNTQYDYVWLKMEYLKHMRNWNEKIVTIADVLNRKSGEYTLTSDYKNFELIDLRYKQ